MTSGVTERLPRPDLRGSDSVGGAPLSRTLTKPGWGGGGDRRSGEEGVAGPGAGGGRPLGDMCGRKGLPRGSSWWGALRSEQTDKPGKEAGRLS